MKFFKLIKNKEFLGVASSSNFYEYNPINHTFLLSNEEHGEFIDLNMHLYRDYWMKEVPDYSIEYEDAEIEEISQQEYEAIIEAIRDDPEIINDLVPVSDGDDLTPIIDSPIDIDYLKHFMVVKMSSICNKTIEAGFDLELHGETHHFSLTTQDQLNLMSLGAMAQTQTLIPYHADGESCVFYTDKEINQIVETANALKIYHTTYYNALKEYINNLETSEEVMAVTYGMEIPNEYKTEVLKILEQ